MRTLLILLASLLFFACKPDEIIKPYDLKDISIGSQNIDWRSVIMFDMNTGFIGGIPRNRFIVHFTIDQQVLLSDTIIYNIDHTYNENGLTPEPCLFKTTDGGVSWLPVATPFRNGVMQINFINPFVGFVATFDEGVYKTTDAGVTWRKILSSQIFGRGFSLGATWNVSFKDATEGFAYLNSVHSLKTYDGGNTWMKNEMNKGKYIYHKENSAYVDSSTSFYKTDDSGLTWSSISIPAESIFCTYFISTEKYFIAAGNKILETMDGGISWSSYQLPNWYSADKFVMFGKEAFLLDPTGVYHFPDVSNLPLRHTEYRMTSKRNERIFDIAFPDASTGFAVGNNGLILKYVRR